jgi:hypothetical protein
MSKVVDAVLRDNPLFFYVTLFDLYSDPDKKMCVAKPNYEYAGTQVKEYAKAVKDYLRVFDAAMGKSELDKELFVHDYCLGNFRYDESIGKSAHSVLGPVLKKAAVCEGIAKFAKLAFDYLGMKSLIVAGNAKSEIYNNKMEPHVWNIVRMDGKTYHLDIMFDMATIVKANRYDYFNISDRDIGEDHVVLGDAPKCVTSGGDYYTQNGMTADGWRGFDEYVTRNLKNGKKSFVVKLTGISYTNDIADQVMEAAGKRYADLYRSGYAIEVDYNPSQMVFELSFK